MPTPHASLTGANLHEVKGAAGATAGHVYRANGSNSASFVDPLTLSNIQFGTSVSASRTADINPSVVDTPIIAGFDSSVANADCSIDSSGTITLTTGGVYFTTFNLNFGRTSGVGIAIIAARLLLNDVQFGFSQAMSMDNLTSSRPSQFNIIRAYNPGDVLKVQLMRDSAGINNGGLLTQPITPVDWTDVPSYWVRVAKVVGAV